MKKSRPLIFIAALAFAMASILSCSSDSSSGNPIKKAKISGVSQKGPFMEGSKATLYELNDSFEQTGRSFADIIADDRGSFEIRNVELVSPYAILEADGYYRNENTGGESGPIKLFAIADLREKDQVNVNVLTHIEYHRVLALVDQGKTVKEAKRQAQKEIFAVFGIDSDDFKDSEDMSVFGNSESDAALLAISVLLLGDLSEGEFSQRLTNFAQAIKNGGAWNNEGAKAAMAEWAHNANLASVKSNILSWGLVSEVPEFGDYIQNYWHRHYDLKNCDASRNNEVKIAKNVSYICSDNLWQKVESLETYCLSGLCDVFTDPRDNEEYKTIKFNDKTIMIESLRYVSEDGKFGTAVDIGTNIAVGYSDDEVELACPNGWHYDIEYRNNYFDFFWWTFRIQIWDKFYDYNYVYCVKD